MTSPSCGPTRMALFSFFSLHKRKKVKIITKSINNNALAYLVGPCPERITISISELMLDVSDRSNVTSSRPEFRITKYPGAPFRILNFKIIIIIK